MRNRIAAVLLLASWPVCLIHRQWQKLPLTPVSWIQYDSTVLQDFRWYLFANELWLSAVFVLVAWLISTGKTRTLKILILANLLISVIDIVHYWLFFRRNIWFLSGEGTVIVVATVIITYNASTHKNEKAR